MLGGVWLTKGSTVPYEKEQPKAVAVEPSQPWSLKRRMQWVALWGPEVLRTLRLHIPNKATGSYTANIPQNNVSIYLDLYVTPSLGT